MRNFVAHSVQNMRPSGIRRYFEIAATMDDVITLGIGEPDFATPSHIASKGMECLRTWTTRVTRLTPGHRNCARRIVAVRRAALWPAL